MLWSIAVQSRLVVFEVEIYCTFTLVVPDMDSVRPVTGALAFADDQMKKKKKRGVWLKPEASLSFRG